MMAAGRQSALARAESWYGRHETLPDPLLRSDPAGTPGTGPADVAGLLPAMRAASARPRTCELLGARVRAGPGPLPQPDLRSAAVDRGLPPDQRAARQRGRPRR